MELFVRGLLHSDIKPANIVLVKQRFLHIYDVRLIDFGIATDEW
jgi:serine/threonine protein kinase